MEWNTDENIHMMIIDARQRYQLDFFMEILIIGCWSIWKHSVSRCVGRRGGGGGPGRRDLLATYGATREISARFTTKGLSPAVN